MTGIRLKILTFDIEDWFHLLGHAPTSTSEGWSRRPSRVEGNTELILSELQARGLKATFFCLGWIAERYPGIVHQIDAAGHQIGTHSYAHQLVHNQSVREFERDLVRSIRVLEDLTGKRVEAYRAPGFSVSRSNPWVFERLLANGISLDCSVLPAHGAHGGDEGFCEGPSRIEFQGGWLRELPVNVGRILGRNMAFSGGGYFRMLPYPLIRRKVRRADYVMTYFHPRDFDPDQPVVEGLSLARRLRSRVGLGGALAKLRRLLDEFEFIDVAAASLNVDWSRAPRVALQSGDELRNGSGSLRAPPLSRPSGTGCAHSGVSASLK